MVSYVHHSSDQPDAERGALLGDSGIIAFRYHTGEARFLSVAGPPGALMGFALADWQAPDFLLNALSGPDRETLPRLLAACRPGAPLLRACSFRDAGGSPVSVLFAGQSSEGEPAIVEGQMIVLDPDIELTRSAAPAHGPDLRVLRFLADRLSHQARSLSGYGQLLERHLATQRDDLGSEYALGMRNTIADMESVARKLRPLATGELSQEQVSTALSELKDALTADWPG